MSQIQAQSVRATMYKYLMDQNNEEMDQVMQIEFPLVQSNVTYSGNSLIELFKCPAKKEFYIELGWDDKLYILPLDKTLTFQYVIDYIIGCIPEMASFTKQGYKFEFELENLCNSEIYTSTETILRAPMTQIPLSHAILHYIIPSIRTLDNHRWFVSRFAEQTEQVQEQDIKKKHVYKTIPIHQIMLIAFGFIVLSNIDENKHALFTLFLFIIILFTMAISPHEWLEPETEEAEERGPEKKVYMCFTRPEVLNKNTHYIFSGTKSQLRSALEKIERDNSTDFIDTYQDDLLDTPLDTLCDDLCHCESELDKTSNYDCSQWKLMSFDTQNELDDYDKAIAMQGYCNGFRNEIIYI